MNQDTLPIIFSFLKPIDLISIRQIDRFFSDRVRLYFLFRCNSSSIEEHICPLCSDWIHKKIYDEDQDELNRKKHTVNTTLSLSNERSFLFCKDCQYSCNDSLEFPFRGSRKYYTFSYYNTSVFPWSILYYQDKNRIKKWEEIRSLAYVYVYDDFED